MVDANLNISQYDSQITSYGQSSWLNVFVKYGIIVLYIFPDGGERMGSAIDRKFFRTRRTAIPQALFLLQSERLLPADAATLNLGVAVSEVMRTIPAARRPQALHSTVEQLLSTMPFDVVLRRVDILFDPAWRIDVLKFLLAVGRNRRLYILWPGTVSSSILEYSEPGYPDYCRYDISGYVDAYIILK